MIKGWETKTLGEICVVDWGNTDLTKSAYVGGGKYLAVSAAGCDGRIGHKEHEKYTPVLSAIGAQCGRMFLPEEDFTAIKNTITLTPRDGICTGRFLYQLLTHVDLPKRGAAQPFIAKGDIQTFQVPVPPLAEQQRIAGVLDEAFAGLATAQAHAAQNLQNARALFESHLQSVFTHRGKGWVETTLGEIGKVSMCKRIFKEETTATGDIPFYKIGTFGKEPDAFIPIQTYNEYRSKYSFPKKGDVLVSASGTIGRRVRYDGEPAYFQDSNIVWIDNDEEQVLNDYLFHFYGACEWNSTKGATISRLYNDNLRQIAISFPDSHHEQKRIVTQLDALAAETQRLTRLYEQKQAALAALKKSLLHQAFTGEL